MDNEERRWWVTFCIMALLVGALVSGLLSEAGGKNTACQSVCEAQGSANGEWLNEECKCWTPKSIGGE